MRDTLRTRIGGLAGLHRLQPAGMLSGMTKPLRRRVARAPKPQPVFATVQVWCAISGMGKTTTYQALAAGRLRAKKLGRRILIDVEHGLSFVRSLPSADIKLPNSRRP